MSLTDKHLYRFRDFTLDIEEKTLVSEGDRISLTPKVFELLLLFVENSGKLITKDEILEKVWANSFVEEGNLTFTVNQLRKLLNDNARQPNFIETIPRRGYRFIAEVEQIQNNNLPTAEPNQTVFFNLSKQSKIVLISALILLISGVVVVAFWTSYGKTSGFLSKSFNLEKITDSGRSPISAISPDGKFIIYGVTNNEKTSLWRRQLETGENSQILPPIETRYVEIYISKDKETLFFSRLSVENPKLIDIYRMSIFGGVPVRIVSETTGKFGISPDEKLISYIHFRSKVKENGLIYLANTDGSNVKQIDAKPNYSEITDTEFSPFENSIIFAHGQSSDGGKEFSLSKINLDTGEIRDIAKNSFFRIQRLKVLPEKDKYLVSGRTEGFGYSKIWLVDGSGKVEPLTKDSDNYLNLSLDEKAEKLVANQVRTNFNIFLFEISNPNLSQPFTAAFEGLTYSPNGKIIYSATSGDKQNLWEMNPDGSGQRQLTNSQKNLAPLVSRDGKFIFYASGLTGVYQLWRMNEDGSNQIQLTKIEGGYPLGFSPDGKYVYYRAALKNTIRQVPIDGGEEKVVFEKVALFFAISPDGTKVARPEPAAKSKVVKIYSLATQQAEREFPFAADATDFGEIVWSPDGNSLGYIAKKDQEYSLWLQKLNEETPTKISDLGTDSPMQIAFAPDGKNFAVLKGDWEYDTVLFNGFK